MNSLSRLNLIVPLTIMPAIVFNVNRYSHNRFIIRKNSRISTYTLLNKTFNIIASININTDFKIIIIFVDTHFFFINHLINQVFPSEESFS